MQNRLSFAWRENKQILSSTKYLNYSKLSRDINLAKFASSLIILCLLKMSILRREKIVKT